jgi:phenylacetic acid degradation operon negative regulatory protein
MTEHVILVKPAARSLILNTLLATEGRGQTVRAAIASCALFGIRENSVRVALVRLAAEGLIEPAGRGAYRLGPRAAALAEDVVTWRTAEERVRDWNGAWIAVHVGALGRSDRAALRTRERALNLLGLRELDRGLHVRPDNLADGVAGVRDRLAKLGLDDDAAVFVASDFDADREARARRLWDGRALTRAYRSTRLELERWLDRRDVVDPRLAARDAYLLGNDAIRLLVFDPLLPAPLVDVDERRALAATVRRVDEAGRAVWRRLRLTPDDRDFTPPTAVGFELTAIATRT